MSTPEKNYKWYLRDYKATIQPGVQKVIHFFDNQYEKDMIMCFQQNIDEEDKFMDCMDMCCDVSKKSRERLEAELKHFDIQGLMCLKVVSQI